MNDHPFDTDHNGTITPWLSVIIPIYNAEKYLVQCLDSIAKQTFRDFEVLLMNDGSTDTSGDICRRYAEKDSRFRYVLKENGGSYQTRIMGAELAKGAYVTFCDADDYYTTQNAFNILHKYLSTSSYSALLFGYSKNTIT